MRLLPETTQTQRTASLRREAVQHVLEDSWASADPYQVNGPGLGSVSTDLFHHSYAFHNAQPGSRRDGSFPPFYRTQEEQLRIIDAGRLVEGLCATASNVLDVLSLFCIGTGYEYTVVATEEADTALAEKAQDVIDKWIREQYFYGWERELFRRSRRDGEAFLYLEPDDVSGLFSLRSIEPECVREPQDAPSLKQQLGVRDTHTWKYGVLTPRNDTSRPDAIWVVSNYSDDQNVGEWIPAEDMVHIKTEWPDRQAKRGVSDFFSTTNQIHRTKKLLRRLTESSIAQAAIVWIRTHPEGGSLTGSSGISPNTTRAGRNVPAVHYESSTVLDVTHGMEYAPGPVSEASPLVEILQAALRAIGARWQIPESLISGDASNNNLASALVAEGPFVKAMKYRQYHYKHVFGGIIERLLEKAAATGQLGVAEDSVLEKLAVNVDMPAVVDRNWTEETARNATLYQAGILSKQTWSAREDLDYEEEKKMIQEDPPDRAEFIEDGEEGEEGNESEDTDSKVTADEGDEGEDD